MGPAPFLQTLAHNKLSFIDSFQFLSSSLDSLVKNLNKDDFKCLSQELDKNKLDLLKQKEVYPYEYMTDYEKFKKNYQVKKSSTVRYYVKKLVTKKVIMFLMFGINLNENIKRLSQLVLKV